MDESYQLSMAHATDPESLDTYRYAVDPGTVLEWNRLYNMDPGAYSFLMNLLSPVVGNRFYLYRLLSISLFVLGVSILLRKLTAMHGVTTSFLDSVFWSSILLLLLTALVRISSPYFEPLPFANLINSGFAMRAYGLQVLLVSVLIFASGWYESFSMRKYLLVAFLLFFGCMVRYDFILFAAAFLLAILVQAMQRGEVRRLLAYPGTWIIALSALAGVLTAYKLSYEYQKGVESGPIQLPHLIPFILDKQESVLLFFKSFRNIVALIVMGLVLARIPRHGIGILETLYVALFTICLSLSLMGMYPFTFVYDRCMSLNLILDAMLIHFSLMYLRMKRAPLRDLASGFGRFLSRYALYIAVLAILASSLLAARSYRSYGGTFLTSTMLKKDFGCFEQTIDSARRSSVYIDWFAIPIVNVAYQMKSKKMPPHDYVLGTFGPQNVQARRYWQRIDELKDSLKLTDCDYYYVPCQSWNAEFRKYMDGRFERLPCVYSLYRKR